MGQVFGEEFRREAVGLVRTSVLSRERIAADSGIGKSTLAKWVQLDSKLGVQAGRSGPSGAPKLNKGTGDFDLLKENERLRRENKVLRVESYIGLGV